MNSRGGGGLQLKAPAIGRDKRRPAGRFAFHPPALPNTAIRDLFAGIQRKVWIPLD